jgi:hypothetical protein
MVALAFINGCYGDIMLVVGYNGIINRYLFIHHNNDMMKSQM